MCLVFDENQEKYIIEGIGTERTHRNIMFVNMDNKMWSHLKSMALRGSKLPDIPRERKTDQMKKVRKR